MPTWLVATDDILIFWIGVGKRGLLWSRGKPLLQHWEDLLSTAAVKVIKDNNLDQILMKLAKQG